jgi:hypothetical protein
MSILSRIFGKRNNPRVEMVKKIAQMSIKSCMDHEALSQYTEKDIHFIDKLSTMQVMSLPDATVLTLFEQYIPLVESGMSENDAIIFIEKTRNKAVPGRSQFPTNFLQYVYYRVAVEHGDSCEDRLLITIKIIKDMLLGGNESAR